MLLSYQYWFFALSSDIWAIFGLYPCTIRSIIGLFPGPYPAMQPCDLQGPLNLGYSWLHLIECTVGWADAVFLACDQFPVSPEDCRDIGSQPQNNNNVQTADFTKKASQQVFSSRAWPRSNYP